MKLLELNFFAYPMQQFNRKGSLAELHNPKDVPQGSQLFPPIVLFLNTKIQNCPAFRSLYLEK